MLKNSVVIDFEADGLLYDASVIWCITIGDIYTKDILHFGPNEIEKGLLYIMECDHVIGHNLVMYDLALARKLYPWFNYDLKRVDDTFIMSSLFEPDRPGGHSVEQYAIEFGGEQKVQNEDWSQYTPLMRERNISDVRIQMKIWDKLKREKEAWDWSKALALEYRIAEIHAQQVLAGVQLDLGNAYELADEIALKIQDIDDKLNKELPLLASQVGVEVKAPFLKNGDYSKMVKDWYGEQLSR